MTMTDITIDDIRVWVGCLSCYNEGRLTGDWVEALEAADHTPCHRPGHEEWWCLDHENLPMTGECSPAEAQRIAEALNELDDHFLAPAIAWLKGDPANRDLDNFEDRYAGHWDSLRAYAEEMFHEFGYDDFLEQFPDHMRHWVDIDWDAVTRDLTADIEEEPAPDGGIYLYHYTI